MKTTLAGLGIGGLALALGAQKSLENVMGGVSIADGQSGDMLVTFARSAIKSGLSKISDCALSSYEHSIKVCWWFRMGRWPKCSSRILGLAKNASSTRTFHCELRRKSNSYGLCSIACRVCWINNLRSKRGRQEFEWSNFAGAAFELELWAYATTADWAAFTAIRQDVILKIAEIVEAAGTRFAAPTQLTYLSRDPYLDAEKENGLDLVRHTT